MASAGPCDDLDREVIRKPRIAEGPEGERAFLRRVERHAAPEEPSTREHRSWRGGDVDELRDLHCHVHSHGTILGVANSDEVLEDVPVAHRLPMVGDGDLQLIADVRDVRGVRCGGSRDDGDEEGRESGDDSGHRA